jgi:hypothetical protein
MINKRAAWAFEKAGDLLIYKCIDTSQTPFEVALPINMKQCFF